MRKLVYILVCTFFGTTLTFGQVRKLSIRPSLSPILIDGQILEPSWQEADVADRFTTNMPYDSLPASAATEVRMSFDQDFLYIAAKCHAPMGKELVTQSLKRDFDLFKNEAFVLFIDAFSDGNSSIAFGVNAHGVQLDGIIPRGGTKGLSLSWDGKWYAEVVRNIAHGYWVAELAIPLKTLRFKENCRHWRINFARIDLGNNEHSSWNPLPRGFNLYTLSHLGYLHWEQPLSKPKRNITLVPYAAATASNDFESTEKQTIIKPGIGLDAKMSLNASLNLDLTINPDFSQVEVDEQVIDLNRFEISFPEKRILFLENSDLFSNLGNSRVRPFFSRRIGSVGNAPVPVFFGARLSGKLNKDWRVGLMSVQTGDQNGLDHHSQNYLVSAIEAKVLSNSSISAFITNRQAFSEKTLIAGDFNRVGGLEFNYRSSNSRWDGKALIHSTFLKENRTSGLVYSAKLRYRTRTMSLFLGFDKVGENYRTDMEFVPRLYHENYLEDTIYRIPYQQVRSNGYYRFYPKHNSSHIAFYGPAFHTNLFLDHNYNYQEHDFDLSFFVQFLNSSKLEFFVLDYAPRLFFPFQLMGMDKAIEAGNYPGRGLRLDYSSDQRKFLSGKVSLAYGAEFGGNLFDFFGELKARKQPWGALSLNLAYRNLSNFPQSFGSPKFTLLGSKFELSFSRDIFFTTFLQYNTQNDNFNINSRFQWRFQPMSDLFVVYTENYRTGDLSIKDRAVVLKIKYWFNP